MRKQKKQLLIMLLVLVLLVAGYVAIRFYNSNSASKDSADEVSVLEIPEESIASITYDYNDVTYELVKEGDEWTYPADATVDIDESKMNPLLLAVESITSDTMIENVADMEQYGLNNPARTVTVGTQGGDTYTILMGDQNAVINAYYLCMNGENTVYTVQGYRYTNFDKTPWDLAVEETQDSETTEE